ncbi:MAG: YigZ family protein [Balneolales bacterium]|nr:YigZ family protein [Balneolales bacterium]
MSQTYRLVQNHVSFEQKIQGSRFLSFAIRCDSREAFDHEISALKKEHFTATHHCYAWRINPFKTEEFSQDDGEPSGTAGMPILNELRSRNFCNTGIVVIRYYGGTKLGKSGLIHAYGSSAKMALDQADLSELQAGFLHKLSFPYEHKRLIDDIVKDSDATIADQVFTQHITYKIKIATNMVDRFTESVDKLSYLGLTLHKLGPTLIESPIS